MTLTLPFPCSQPHAGQLLKHDLALRDDNERQSATCAVCGLIRCRRGATLKQSARPLIAQQEDSHGDGKEQATCRLRGARRDDSVNELERYGGSLSAPERWRGFYARSQRTGRRSVQLSALGVRHERRHPPEVQGWS